MSNEHRSRVDFIEAGAGPLVVLVHSSMSGARQWSALMGDLEDRFRVRAVNLFGYGGTPAWSRPEPPMLDDFADLVALAIPDAARNVSLVGHSFGAAVAMQAAHRLGGVVDKLILFEPSLFYLLQAEGRHEAFAEISGLSERMREHAAPGTAEAAAEQFVDYWAGRGTWAASPVHRRTAYVQAVGLVLKEWGASLVGDITLAQWAKTLPARTLIVSSARPTRPSLEVMQVLAAACPAWQSACISDGGHLAPLTHPHLVNSIIGEFLTREPDTTRPDKSREE